MEKKIDFTEWPDILSKKGISIPLSAQAEYALALTVNCSFCGAAKSEKCMPGKIFPQYPHTPRIFDAASVA